MLKKILYCLAFSLAGAPLHNIASAQERDVNKLSDPKKFEVAEAMIELGSFYGAIEPLLVLAQKNPSEPKYAARLGEAYFLARDYENAEKWLKTAQNLYGSSDDLFAFMLAESYKFNGKYDEASAQFAAFDKGKYRERKGESYRVIAKAEINNCLQAKQLKLKERKAFIISAGDKVNVGYSDFAPSLQNDSTLVYSSFMSDTVLTSEYLEPNFNRVKLYTSAFDKENDEWSDPEEMKHLSRHLESTANGVYSPEGDEFYFTRCRNGKKGQMLCKIYMCKVKDGKFSKPVFLEKNINVPNSTQTQPHVVNVGNGKQTQKILYFASNRKGGRGGMDIWYAVYNQKIGLYDRPVNCGAEINSIRDEVTPFYNVKEGSLYFSSNSHAGLGGLDIFKAKGAMKSFSLPENVGVPLNTSYDDAYYTLGASGTAGYLVSNRPGGKAAMGATCCDDVYAFDLEKPIAFGKNRPAPAPKKDTIVPVVARVEQPKKDTVIPEPVVAQVIEKQEPIEKPKSETPVVIKETIVPEPPKKKQRKPKVESKPEVVAKQTEPKPKSVPKPQYVRVRTRVIVEFATDKDSTYLEYYPKLDSIANVLASDTIPVKVVVTGHTDKTGGLEHNQALSERRAQRMVDYLTEHGVKPENLSMKGEGERKPIDTNATAKGRRHNRRVEFLYTRSVLKKGKNKK